jgi:undecaprenyl-diphosphatase
MRRAERALPLRHAVALGLVQGPAELLPISSSAHTTLLPWLLRWPYGELDGATRKSFELALHAGAGLALTIDMRRDLGRALAQMDGPRAAALALSILPPALAGQVLRGRIERRLGGPSSIAAGLLIGGVAMALADARPRGGGRRRCEQACACDGLALGVAQALALIPGISRNGATLTAARARGFERSAARSLSWNVALPVLLGASLLEAARVLRDGAGREVRSAVATGGGVAFLSTLASARVLRRGRYGDHALLPYSLYRCLLAAFVVGRLRRPR